MHAKALKKADTTYIYHFIFLNLCHFELSVVLTLNDDIADDMY